MDEKAVVRRNKAADHALDNFEIGQGRRKALAYKRDYSREYRRRHI